MKVPKNENEVNDNDNQAITLSAGYWCKLGPLPPGIHNVRFGGTGWNGFHTKVEYKIKIEKKNSL